MTVEDVLKKVQEIAAKSSDDEAAHVAEDALYASVLEAIATCDDGAKALAEAALLTKDIAFSRWYA